MHREVRLREGEECGWKRVLRETIAQDDIAWWTESNESCEASDYPCFGPKYYNQHLGPRERRAWIQRDADRTPAGIAKEFRDAGSDLDLYYWAELTQMCVAKAWVKNHGFDAVTDDEVAAEKAERDGTGAAALKATATIKPAPDDPIRASHCAEALRKQDEQFEQMNARAPKPEENKGASGAKALYQMGMYITDARLKVLDEFCKGEPQYAMYPSTKQSFDVALAGCKALSSDGGESCKPLKLW